MDSCQADPTSMAQCYALRFRSLFQEGRSLVFPCDEGGHVDMDALSERAKLNYLFARTLIGREYLMPEVEVLV